MTGNAGPQEPKNQIQIVSGQGVQVGEGNIQNNTFIEGGAAHQSARLGNNEIEPPRLKARLIPSEEDRLPTACRLEAKIVSSQPLMNIVIILPYGDGRLSWGGAWYQTRRFGSALLQPGNWLPFEGLIHLRSANPGGKIKAIAKCIDQHGERLGNIFVKINLTQLPHQPPCTLP